MSQKGKEAKMGKLNCGSIMVLFDPDPETPLTKFCLDLIERDEPGQHEMVEHFLESEEGKLLSLEVTSAIDRERWDFLGVGFAVGYALGREFEIGDPEISKVANELIERIFEAKALPYFSTRREKKRRIFP
jgi:hypothetical protein